MATTSVTSTLRQDSDFAAELLLNRVMNGQANPQSGMTVTAANRALASKFDATAFNYNVLAENVAYGKTIVEGTQNALTELVSQVKRLGEMVASASDDAMAQDLASAMKKNIDKILETESHGIKVLQNQPKKISIGEDGAEELEVGNLQLTNSSVNPQFGALYSAISSTTPGAITASNALEMTGAAVDELYGKIAQEGARNKILSNRYDMLNDLASTYHKASDDSAKQDTASDYTLLNVVS